MRFLKNLFKRQKPEPPMYEVKIARKADGHWEYSTDGFGKAVDGEIVLAALMLHVQAVSERTNVNGRTIIENMGQVADENTLTFYPAFEGL